MKLKEIYQKINSFAPFSLSDELCKATNGYDNSGIIADCEREVDTVVFALDLTFEAVDMAIENNAQLIVTHHPAIYSPISKIEGALLKAVQKGISVISAHLNFDVAEFGIDYFFAKGLGGESQEILLKLSQGGYGRRFVVDKTLGEMVEICKTVFRSNKVVCYGDESAKISSVATFCGAGLDGDSLKANADLIISADGKHHLILQALESGKSLILVTHYAGENYGFKNAVDLLIKNQFKQLNCVYFDDLRLL